jgi:DNA-binding MarR family transcriptional regulator
MTDDEDRIVASIRRIVRAIDLHSRHLMDEHGLTAPQLATLAEAERQGAASVGALARALHLSQPTVSGILDRLERRALVRRQRAEHDRRSVAIVVTEEGSRVRRAAPSLLQETFRQRLSRLEDWERHWLLAALQRVAAMMDAEALDAAPVLETGPIEGPPSDAGESAGATSELSGRRGRAGRARSGERGSGEPSPEGA